MIPRFEQFHLGAAPVVDNKDDLQPDPCPTSRAPCKITTSSKTQREMMGTEPHRTTCNYANSLCQGQNLRLPQSSTLPTAPFKSNWNWSKRDKSKNKSSSSSNPCRTPNGIQMPAVKKPWKKKNQKKTSHKKRAKTKSRNAPTNQWKPTKKSNGDSETNGSKNKSGKIWPRPWHSRWRWPSWWSWPNQAKSFPLAATDQRHRSDLADHKDHPNRRAHLFRVSNTLLQSKPEVGRLR